MVPAGARSSRARRRDPFAELRATPQRQAKRDRADRGRKMMTRWSSCVHGPGLFMLVFLLVGSAGAQQAPRTDPTEAAALNAVFVKLGLMVPLPWINRNPCADPPNNATFEDDYTPNFFFMCDCTAHNSTICHITKLRIYSQNAVGRIPEELRNLTHLTELDLRQNYLTGPLPSFLGELSAMQYMSLDINTLSGTVPKELGNLRNLVVLGFGSNNLSGSLPWDLGNLANLEQLYIDSAGLSGPLPSSFSKLTRMKVLWASDNDFTGQIPDYVGSWSNLTELRLQGNSFQGPIPATLSKLVQLRSLRIGDIVNGSSSMAFISNMTSLNTLCGLQLLT